MVDVNISASDNLAAQPQDDDVIAIIRDGTTVLSQSWADFKAALIPDPTARQSAAAASAEVTAHEGTPHNTDATARAAAAAAEADATAAQTTANSAHTIASAAKAEIDAHEAGHGTDAVREVHYITTTTYNATEGRLEGALALGDMSNLLTGQLLIFQLPGTIPDSGADSELRVTGQTVDRTIRDHNNDPIPLRALLPNGVYWSLIQASGDIRLLDSPGEIDVVRRVHTTITNAQLKNLDTNYLALIPAPGAGKFINLQQMWLTKHGSDTPTPRTTTDPPNYPPGLTIYGVMGLLYIPSTVTADEPYFAGDGHIRATLTNFNSLLNQADGYQQNNVLRPALYDNLGIHIGVSYARHRNFIAETYTEAGFDAYMAGVDDVSLDITVRYQIIDGP